MQVFFKPNLALLSVPKTGTTAMEIALRPRADITFNHRSKHMRAGKFHDHVAPMLENLYGLTPERIAVMRNPVDHLRSWYKYRAKPSRKGKWQSTAEISFDDFVLASIERKPPAWAKVGSQHQFLAMRDGMIPVHRLFAYEDQPQLLGFLSERFGAPMEFPRRNVSPDVPAPISAQTENSLRAARAKDFALYDRLLDAGGQMCPMPV